MIQIYYKYACIGASKHFTPLRMREKPHGRAAENSNGAWIKSLQSGPPGTRLVGNQSFLPWGAAGYITSVKGFAVNIPTYGGYRHL